MATELCSKLMKIENVGYTRKKQIIIEREISDLIREQIRGYRKVGGNDDRNDIFAMLMNAIDEDGNMLEEEEIHDELITVLKAGFGTTANTLSWVFECLLSNPKALLAVKDQLDKVVGSDPISKSHINKLTYISAVLKETLRLRPLTVMNGVRLVKETFKIGNYEIPPGVILVNATYILHKREDVFENPEAFKPERFLDPKKKITPYMWAPFGGGLRMCAGRAFAMQEMSIVVATVLRMVHLEKAEPVTRAERQGFFLSPEKGMLVNATKI